MSDQQRGLLSPVLNTFKGLNRFTNVADMPANYAMELLNVVCSVGGGMMKLRVPTTVSTNVMPKDMVFHGMSDFQQPNGTRQIIIGIGENIYSLNNINDTYVPTKVDTNPLNNGDWSFTEANNLLFMCNGLRAVKWDGQSITNWGVYKPLVAPVTDLGHTGTIASFSRTANVATYTVDDTSKMALGDLLTTAGCQDATFNAVDKPIIAIPDSTHVHTDNIGTDVANTLVAPGPATWTFKGTLTFILGGRSYKASLKTTNGHVSTATPPTAATGNLVTAGVTVTLSDPATLAAIAADPQVYSIIWWATVDAGTEYFYHSEEALPGGLILSDRLTDIGLNKSRVAPLVNDPPIVGKYSTQHGGRIFIGNLDGSPSDMIYSGYEQIQEGRPEESFPPNNRLRLAMGADELRGLGVIQSGIIAGDKSNELYMFKGEVEDIVTGVPIAFSAVLEELPFNTGIASHRSIAKTPNGLQFFSANRTVDVYSGSDAPDSTSLAVTDLLASITKGMEEAVIGEFFNYLDKDWYVMAIPVEGSVKLGKILVFDIGNESETNCGIFLFDVGEFDGMTVVEDSFGAPQLMIFQDGWVKKFQVIVRNLNGIPKEADVNVDPNVTLPAYWVPGYVGNDSPQIMKHFKKVTVLSTSDQIGLQLRFVNDRENTLMAPKIVDVPYNKLKYGVYSPNWKSRRLSPGIIFPDVDMNCAVLSAWVTYMNLSER